MTDDFPSRRSINSPILSSLPSQRRGMKGSRRTASLALAVKSLLVKNPIGESGIRMGRR